MNEEKTLQYLKRLTAELRETRQRLRDAEEVTTEPLAIVGMACRYPGGVTTPEALWRLVETGTDAIGPFPLDRDWDVDGLRSARPGEAGSTDTLQGGFLYDAAEFDADFFGISPREALAMDPQQRLLLETAWEAVERARVVPASLRGSRTGVFVGIMYHDYASRLAKIPDIVEGHLGTGNSGSIASGRLAYFLGLEGPAVTIDTACSSSLVALHLAGQALRRGECSLALVGGATVMASPAPFIDFSRQQGLASDGRCKAFADTADGTGWAEGAGVLVVERLSDAVRNAHPVLAVVRGSAVNQDGASNGLTAPNGLSQQRVIRDALIAAGLRADQVDAVEAHGTGTRLGDPIEAQALLAVYGQNRREPLHLGSVKSNIGHTQAAAGIAGVIKMIMAMKAGVLPRTLHVDKASTAVDWSTGAVALLTEQVAWPEREGTRRAGVSSFGFSGTNAHVILEQATESESSVDSPVPPAVVPWVLSARDGIALRAQATRLADHLDDDASVLDVGYSLATTRAALGERAVVLAADLDEYRHLLRALAAGEVRAGVVTDRATDGGVAMVFSGQGSQRLGMGKELHNTYPVYAEAFDAACAELDPHLPSPLRDVIFGDDSDLLNQTLYTQPALFAFQTALYRLWEHWGIVPTVLIGHSIGEITAAHVAGTLSLTDAATLITTRAQLMQTLPSGGAMLAINTTENDVLPHLASYEDKVSIAAINTPTSLVLSGEHTALTDIAQKLTGHRTTWLRVSHAFHSPLMDPILTQFHDVLSTLTYSPPSIPIISTLTGKPQTLTDAQYWTDHARHTVRYADATTHTTNHTHLEISPTPTLTTTPSLQRNTPEPQAITTTLAKLIANGTQPNWHNYFTGTNARATALPTYPFQRNRFWLKSADAAGGSGHPFLGAAVDLADGDRTLLTGALSLAAHPWLADHTVHGDVLLPGTAFVELALHAGARAGHPCLAELTLSAPLVLDGDSSVHVQVLVEEPDTVNARAVTVFSRPAEASPSEPWTEHAVGLLTTAIPQPAGDLASWPPAAAVPVNTEGAYTGSSDLRYGPAFQGLGRAWHRDGVVFAEVDLNEAQHGDADRFTLHPALLDAALHALGLGSPDAGTPLVPFAWSGVVVHAVNARRLRVRISPAGQDTVSLLVADPSGRPVLDVARLTLRPRPRPSGTRRLDRSLFRTSWVELPHAKPGTEPGLTFLPFHPGEDDAERAAARLLATLQDWLGDEDSTTARLAVVTTGTHLLDTDAPPDLRVALANAAVWGLVRSAQAEHPDRFVLADVDDISTSWREAVTAAVAEGDPQIAVRRGVSYVPRLVHVTPGTVEAPDWSATTVLITGATGALGGSIARHLVHTHGARDLLLLGRSPIPADLREDLTAGGAHVTSVVCDLTDRDQIAAGLDGRKIGAVVHCAGALDDAVITNQTPEHLRHTFAPKATAAWHLHELTQHHDITAFVLFSSAAATLGSPGQANYAAANAYLDALAHHRTKTGHPTASLAWGFWNTGMANAATTRRGMQALEEDEGVRLFDAALTTGVSVTVPMHLDARAFAESNGSVPSLLRALVPTAPRRAATRESEKFADQLKLMTPANQGSALLALVRDQIAAVLGRSDTRSIDPARPFSDLGFDSLLSVEFRNRLNSATELQLPATLLFDHPDSASLVAHLRAELVGAPAPSAAQAATAATDTDPVVIVAMACRYPGGVDTPEELWRLVATGQDAITAFPTDRGWDTARIYHPDAGATGTTYCREGGFLHDAAEFDAELFSISPREALAMDPQQRLLLETAWETFERAGIDPTSLRGNRTGVFTGIMYNDYAARFDQVPEEVAGHLGNGSAGSIASGRISYTFGLEGPAVTIDTACSSSLVALHLAAQAIRAGECTMALAGGVTVMSTPTTFIEFSRQGGLSPDGRCKAFSSTADGTGWGEGAGVLLLERLSDAQRNNHPVLAIVRGSAVNQDGASNGLTAPNGPSQQRVIHQALANAGLQPSEVDAVEAHGTGTRLGDPIEAQALLATYGQNREVPLWLGSVKSNIGHTQAAAGAAGIIKTIMAMQHGVLPRTLHADHPTPHVDWTTGKVQLLTENQPWPETGRPRRAGISSFGISGTNAHIVLEQPPISPETGEAPDRPDVPWLLSGRTRAALRAQAARLADHVTEHTSTLDVGYALATTRAVLEERAVVVTGDPVHRAQALRALARGGEPSGVITGRATDSGLAMVFSGQGSQRLGMGKELHDTYPVYAEAFDAACAELDPHLPHPLHDIVFGDDSDLLNQTLYTQPALFAFQTALHRLWEHWGIVPTVLIGHSIGEITAAHIAGTLSLADAATLITSRAQLMQALPRGGAMLAINTTENDILPHLASYEDKVSIAAINTPTSLVLSGEHTALNEIAEQLQGHRTTWLRVSHAFHSPLMDPILTQFHEVLSTLTYSPPSIPIISTLTGKPQTLTNAQYWTDHARHTVRFGDAITHTEPGTTHLEISPTPTLTTTPSLQRNTPEPQAIATTLAKLIANGTQPNWHNYFTGGRSTPLPTYAFQHQRYWLDHRAQVRADLSDAGVASAGHALLAMVVADPESDAQVYSGRISLSSHPWLADHEVAGRVVLPGTAHVDLVLHAGIRTGLTGVDDLTLETPLVIPAGTALDLSMTVEPPDAASRRTVRIHSRESGTEHSWVRHATAVLVAPDSTAPVAGETRTWPPPTATPLDLLAVYDQLADRGLHYGPLFRGLRAAWRRPGEVFAEVSLPATAEVAGHVIHPALLDAALHAIGLGDLVDTSGSSPSLPFAWRGVRLISSAATTLRVSLSAAGKDTVSIKLSDVDGHEIGSVEALTLRRMPTDHERDAIPSALLGVRWQDLPVTHSPGATWWAVLGEDEPWLTPALLDSGAPVEAYDDLAALGAAAEASGVTPDAVFFAPPELSGLDVPRAAALTVSRALAFLQAWLADLRFSASRLVVVTRDAAAGPVTAPLTGLVRSAQAEHPDRITLVDVAPGTVIPDRRVLAHVLASGEPQVMIHDGGVRVPRLAALTRPGSESAVNLADGTVLVTGASGALGQHVARHLVAARGVRDLLLVSRSGEMAALRAELEDAGAVVEVAACDVADRDQVAALLARRPVRAVVHTAGVLDDGLLESITAEQLTRVLRPKVDAAWHLHELAGDLSAFVLFSSVAGTLGSAGQAAYAAGNTFLDALAAHRAALGLPAISLAWGPWETENGMAADRHRIARGGVVPFTPESGLALFDAALTRPEPVLVPVHVDTAVLRAVSAREPLPPIWHGLVRPSAVDGRCEDGRALPERLAQAPEDEREQLLLDLVGREVAAVLGHTSPGGLEGDRAFTDLGFDSLTAVDLRNRLERATGVRLSATVVFEQPTPLALAGFLGDEIAAASPVAAAPVDTLGALFRQACAEDRIGEGMALVSMAASFRPVFHTPQELGRQPKPVPLARGPRGPLLICFPAVVAMSGAHQYARFAAGLRDRRDVVVLPEPGFLAGERLPGSVEAIADVQARAVLKHAAGAPYALLGYSSGGWIAHAVAARLAGTDSPPAAVVLIDTYLPQEMNPRLSDAFTTGLFARRQEVVSSDHVSLTAMGGYFTVFESWEPGSLDVPALFLRAADALPGADGAPLADTDWGPTWPLPGAELDTTGDHFTIMEDHAGAAAEIVDAWLADSAEGPGKSRDQAVDPG